MHLLIRLQKERSARAKSANEDKWTALVFLTGTGHTHTHTLTANATLAANWMLKHDQIANFFCLSCRRVENNKKDHL